MAYIDPNNITPDLIKRDFPKYTVPVQCFKDLSITLKEFDKLNVIKRECVVEGHLYDMINLEGTIGVVYKGDKYNIPLRIMLQEDYPHSPPIVYIQPTEQMKISQNVSYLNDRGKVTIDYLSKWKNQNHPDLYKVLHNLCVSFAENPPVWTKRVGNMVNDIKSRAKKNRTKNQLLQSSAVPDGSLPKQPVNINRGETKSPLPKHRTLSDEEVQGFQPFDPSNSVKNEGEFIPAPYVDNNDDVDDGDDKERKTSVNYDGNKPTVLGAEGGINVPFVKQKSISDVLKTYSRKKLIGSGGFAKVYLYEDKATNKEVACKIVDLGVNDSNVKKCAESLKREIQILQPLDHHFIINYISLEEYDNILAIVMEYFPKGSIYSVMLEREEMHLNEPETRQFTWQILQGLMYLHDNGIIHKDIKARNILVDHQNTIKIADFGISKKMRELATATATGSIDQCGSMHWQSPEFLNNQKYGRKTDIWSLGCTVVEMLFGKPPLLCKDNNIPLTSACAKIATGDVHPPPDCPETAKEFVELCLRIEKDRPTAKDLMRESDFPAVSV